MAKVFSSGPMDLLIKASSSLITSRAMATIAGRTAAATVVPGETTRWTGEACSHGPMAAGTRESTSKIRNRGSAHFTGLMEEST